jgi:hypothetical protein
MDFRERGWCGIDWVGLAQDMDQWRAPANTVLKLRDSYKFGKLLSSSATGGLSKRAQLRESCLFNHLSCRQMFWRM